MRFAGIRYFCTSFNNWYVKSAIVLTALSFLVFYAGAQMCTTLGQNPSTAFPVCGTSVFSQSTVPYCGGTAIPGKCSETDGLTDTNPFWYKFTCFSGGTLGFLITPSDLNDDYDWQLFDITGRNANDVYTDASLFVACNWSGNTGLTGASAGGTSLQNCAGVTYPAFSKMPALIVGHHYLLLLSHFTRYTPSQNGYTLSFSGGTASITDTTSPKLENVTTSCDATKIFIRLNKKMKCKSLAENGSDFEISFSLAGITEAVSASCKSGFDMDSLELTLSRPLLPGDYTITVKKGTDGNTLLDNCDQGIPVGHSLPFSILPSAPVPMDSLTMVTCAPESLQLVFKKNMRCNSIAQDGSDFVVTGPSPVIVTGAAGSCADGVTTSILVSLASAVVKEGIYQIILKKGSDGNTLLDECSQQTPEGSTLSFVVKDTVSADFTYRLSEGCKTDTLQFFQDGRNGANEWAWHLDYNGNSSIQNPVAYFNTFGTKQISLSVSNGFCSDTATREIALGNELKAAFETNNLICPEDTATFLNKSIGDIMSYQWDFGNANISTIKDPPRQMYLALPTEKIYSIRLVIANNIGCLDTAFQDLKVLKSCYIVVPTAFTPNGDGLNDFLYPLNAYKADGLQFKVYDRLGQLVFQSKDWLQKWDGTINGEPQDSGIFVWTLQYTHHDTGKHLFLKGSSVLIR